jgi:hypothetical protein
MFGRKPKLPIYISNLIYRKRDSKSVSKYINDLGKIMKSAYELVNKNTKESQEKQKESYDQKTRRVEIQKGDRVLVKL